MRLKDLKPWGRKWEEEYDITMDDILDVNLTIDADICGFESRYERTVSLRFDRPTGRVNVRISKMRKVA